MRIGAIFARGSCRALKWMALFGVVFALGVGSAAAQVTVKADKTVEEGGRVDLTATVKVGVLANTAAETAVTLTPTVSGVAGTGSVTMGEGAGEDFRQLAAATEMAPANAPTDAEVKTATLTFRWRLQTLSDNDSDDEALSVAFVLNDLSGTNVRAENGTAMLANPDNVSITINDTDEQTFEWDVETDKPTEGAPITVNLEADPAPVGAANGGVDYRTALSIDTAGYSLDRSSATLDGGAADGPDVDIVITTPNSDGNREADTITLRAVEAGTTTDRLDALEIEVADIHALPAADKISAKAFLDDGKGKKSKDEAKSVVEGGDPVHVTVTVDRGTTGYPSGEALEVNVTSAAGQALDYRVDPVEIDIASGTGKKTADFKLYALADDDVGAEDLVLSLVATGATAANGAGESTATFTIAIDDQTEPLVSVKEGAYDAIMAALGEDALNPGDSFEVDVSDVFDSADGVTTAYSASVSGGAVSVSVSGEAVTVMAGEPGEAKVTITATGTPATSSLVITQDRANVAQVTFPVMVELADLEVTLSGPEDMNLVEGMSYALTATANRAVVEDTMVELVQTDGSASPADYEVEPITIAAGAASGTTMLMVAEDGTAEDGETVVLEGRFGAEKTNALSFYLWDAAVPALPLLAQLLLAVFLAIGGYRRYLRR